MLLKKCFLGSECHLPGVFCFGRTLQTYVIMQRDLSTFPIPPQVRFKLRNNGFTTVDDLKNIGPVELATDTELTQEEALEVLELIFPESDSSTSSHGDTFSVSALDILQEEKSKPPIPTFCQELDKILGGGIPLKKVTEICGAPGAGKTQMCLQLCVNAQIPEICGGLDGESIYIDTEGSFTVDRLIQIADSTVDNCKKITKGAGIEAFTTRRVLEGIHYFHCKSYVELIAKIHILPEFLQKHTKVSLLIIDSISFHFRYGFEGSFASRTRLLNGLSQSLVKIANEFNMAILLTNQMTTKVHKDCESNLVPALGESWGHACTIRLILSSDEQKRQAYLLKSPWKEEATALYQITTNGIRDFSQPPKFQNLEIPSTSFEVCQPKKKLKINH